MGYTGGYCKFFKLRIKLTQNPPMSVPRDVPDDPSGSREASAKFLSSYSVSKRSSQVPQRPQTCHQLLDPALKKILVGVLGDDGSIQECLASAFLQSIPDVVSQSLDDIDALSLPVQEVSSQGFQRICLVVPNL